MTLRGMTWEHPRGHGSVVAASAAYLEETGIEVQWDYRSLQAFADQPIEQMAATYDLMVVDHPHVPLAAEQGLFAELDGHGHDAELAVLAGQSVGASFESYAHQGHQYGLPTDAAAHVAALREDATVERPASWDDVLELANDGVVVWPAKPIDAFSSLVTIAGTFGHVPNATPGRFLTAEACEQTLDIMHRLAERVPESNLAMNPIEVAEMLCGDGPWQYSPLLFGYTNYSRAGFRPVRLRYIDIVPGPFGVQGSLLAGAGIAVSQASAQVDAAREFAFWLMSARVQSGAYFDGGGQPGNAVAWEDARLNAETLDFFTGTRASFERAYMRPRTAGFIEFQDTVSPWITEALRGELSDTQLLTRMNERAARLLVESE